MSDAESKPWRDAELLRELHHEKGLNQSEIADEIGCAEITVYRWMKRLGVDTIPPWKGMQKKARSTPASYSMTGKGHPIAQSHYDGEHNHVRIHRLMAVAEWGVEAVKGKDVHHKNGIPWDNRFENLEIMDHAEHSRYHRNKEYGNL